MLSLGILHMILSPSPTDEPTSCYVQLNVNDIFLAIAKKLPKDGEGGAAGAGGIRWELTKFQKSQVHLISSDFQGYRRRRRCSKELLLQQITLMWLPNSALKLFRKKNAKKKILDHIDGWCALTSDPAQLVTIYMYHPVIQKWLLKQQLAWSESWLSLHARDHCTDLFILFYSCPGHNHLGLPYVYLTNTTSLNSITLPLKHRVNWVYISTWEVFEHFQDQCHLFYICWKHELCVIYY